MNVGEEKKDQEPFVETNLVFYNNNRPWGRGDVLCLINTSVDQRTNDEIETVSIRTSP